MYKQRPDYFRIWWSRGERSLIVHVLKWTFRVRPRLRPWPLIGFSPAMGGWGTFEPFAVYLLFGRIYIDVACTWVHWPWSKV